MLTVVTDMHKKPKSLNKTEDLFLSPGLFSRDWGSSQFIIHNPSQYIANLATNIVKC
jgi:hypothetical protein